ncbi:MAG TPA: TonB-dependent receptor [Pyrinomonadaceae bacterium]|nr:TonB-dependent receptor [Pyrinomonadaceae bacterium]
MRVFLIILVCSLFLTGTASAQSIGASLQGTITDSTGAVVPGAKVVVRNKGTGARQEVVSDDTGRYHLPLLPPGEYEMEFSAAQFQTVMRNGVRLTVGQDATQDAALAPAGVSAMVQIDSARETVDTSSATLSSLVTQEQIRDLPLNGRSFEQLALLQPGVTGALSAGNDVVGGRTPKISINGARPEQNNFLLDGTDINNVYNKTPGSVAGVLLGVDAVLEFRVLTNAYSAEYGGRAGGVINAVTRSGTNDFHGSGFYFHRNSALDAKNFFDKAGDPIPLFRRHQYGGVIGGPIKHDKSFFFAAYEGLKENLGISGLTFVPDLNARQGILPASTPGGPPRIIPIHPAIPQYLELLFPLPNGPSRGDGTAQYLFSPNQPLKEFFIQGRVDHRLSDKSSLFGRYTISNGNVDRQIANKPPVAFTKERSRNQYVTLEHQYTFSPTSLNILRVGFNRSTQEADNQRTSPMPNPYLPGEQFGYVTVTGLANEIAGDFRLPRLDRLNNFQLGDTVLVTKGHHDIKFGFQGQRLQFNQNTTSQRGGILIFSNLENFLRGIANNVDFAVPGKIDPVRGYRQSMLGLFIQDDWKVAKNMTLNLGLRYEYATVPTEANGKVSNLRNVTDTQVTVGDPWYQGSKLNFAPRVGIAWDPFGDGKTSIRAGFGMFYDQLLPKYYFFSGSLNPPFTTRTTIVRNTAANPPVVVPFPVLTGFDPNAPIRAQLQTTNFDLQTPVIKQFNLSVQRQLPGDWTMTLGYAGSRGNHLIRLADANLAPETMVNGVKVYQPQLGRRNPNFAGIFQRSSDAQSFYNAAQLSLIKQYSHNWRAQLSYTFSRSVDDSSGINSQDFGNVVQYGLDFYDRLADRGLSAFHVKHNLTFNWTYDLPFGKGLDGLAGAVVKGWQLNSITSVRSGHPFTVRMGFNRSGNLNTTGFSANERPNLVPGVNPILGGTNRYLNIAAFALPAANTRGNLGRNTFIGPNLFAMDLSIIKTFNLGEKRKLHFRTEIFNLPNHPNFAVPSGLISFTSAAGAVAGSFGNITSTVTTSRQIQFGLKLEY